MTLAVYLIQLTVIFLTLLALIRNQSPVLKLQLAIWTAVVAVIGVRFGLTQQVEFYSNDQRYYRDMVKHLAGDPWLLDVDRWLTGAKLPFTLPATLLYGIGIEPVLALKTVSIVCLLWLTRDILAILRPISSKDVAQTLVLTACGIIGLFFATLALRETMMMLLTTKFFLTKAPTIRIVVVLLTILLRPHLAMSLVIASFLITVWTKARNDDRHRVSTVVTIVVFGSVFGRAMYSIGNTVLFGSEDVFQYQWGISSITRIASNFVGLQFLTADSETISFSLTSLVLLRLLLVETILIPTLFTLFALLRPHLLGSRQLTILLGFSFYIALVTNTDFNSFRQNIPFMPIMGLMVLQMSQSRKTKRAVGSVA